MARFVSSELENSEGLLLRLQDTATGAEAVVLPSFGNNLLALSLSTGTRTVEIINDLDHLEALLEKPNQFGTPILFPWPGSIKSGKALLNGRESELAAEDGTTHHGFVNRLPWRVVDSGADDKMAWLNTEITSIDCAEVCADYSFEFRLTVNWVLSAQGLKMQIGVSNMTDEPMPFGFGAHPFFKAPFLEGTGQRGDCSIAFDAAGQWQLEPLDDPNEALQSGTQLFDQDGFDEPTELTLGTDRLNHVYQLRSDEAGQFHVELTDPAAGLSVHLTSSEGFRTLVLYTPEGRNVVALEPWTCPPNVFNLDAALLYEDDDQDLEADLLTISPGNRWDGSIRFELREAVSGS